MDKNEAIKIIRSNFPIGRKILCEALEILIPELKENEDEEIRKELLYYIQQEKNYLESQVKPENSPKLRFLIDSIAWLEKQGEQKHLFYPIKDYQGSFPCWNNAHYIRPKHLQRCICYDKYMKGVYCYVYDDISKYWCNQMTEEHDSNGDNHVCDYTDYRITRWMPIPYTSLNVHSKVEPKFKVGDWVVWDNKFSCHIDNIYQGKESLMYTITDTNNMTRSYSVKGFDNNAHLWTIQDAKDGDVLKEDSCIFIIEKMISEKQAIVYCCLFDDGDFDLIGSTLGFDVNSTSPATKEQCDLLFQKMKEAGCEWDAEKKELKKIEQKSSEWSEEDELMFQASISFVKSSPYPYSADTFRGEVGKDEVENWLKSLKERMKGK